MRCGPVYTAGRINVGQIIPSIIMHMIGQIIMFMTMAIYS